MPKFLFFTLASLVLMQFALGIPSAPFLAQESKVQRPKGELRVVPLGAPWVNAIVNYGGALVHLGKTQGD